jgi:hypothetical protein
MTITIQYFTGCPHWKVADDRVRRVVRQLARTDVKVEYELIDSPEGADRAHFRGSPTILIDGHDPFAGQDQAFGLSCRVYETEEGAQGAPSEAQLQRQLARDLPA